MPNDIHIFYAACKCPCCHEVARARNIVSTAIPSTIQQECTHKIIIEPPSDRTSAP